MVPPAALPPQRQSRHPCLMQVPQLRASWRRSASRARCSRTPAFPGVIPVSLAKPRTLRPSRSTRRSAAPYSGLSDAGARHRLELLVGAGCRVCALRGELIECPTPGAFTAIMVDDGVPEHAVEPGRGGFGAPRRIRPADAADERFLQDVFGLVAGTYSPLEEAEKAGVVVEQHAQHVGRVGIALGGLGCGGIDRQGHGAVEWGACPGGTSGPGQVSGGGWSTRSRSRRCSCSRRCRSSGSCRSLSFSVSVQGVGPRSSRPSYVLTRRGPDHYTCRGPAHLSRLAPAALPGQPRQ